MRINHTNYQKYIDETTPLIKDKKIQNVSLINNNTLMLHFLDENKLCLVISLNIENPLVYILNKNYFYSSLENKSFLKFKKEIQNTIIKDLKLKSDDNILIIETIKEDEFKDKIFKIIIELFPKHPNLLVLNEEDKIVSFFKEDKTRNFKEKELYIFPTPISYLNENESNFDFTKHFENELEIRKNEKYIKFIKYFSSRKKSLLNKIKNIENDVNKANQNIFLKDTADAILCENIDLKKHQENIIIDDKIIPLEKNKTILENVQIMFKKAKKGKETILLANKNINNAKNEIEICEEILNKFNSLDEYHKDKMVLEYFPDKKKKEIKETPFNKPYKINYNGTIIYFGKNSSQNDYLSFVMKLDREFIWMHIKDKSGSHIVICNKKPTEKELLLGASIALLCSKSSAGEITYTKKKNVRRGHYLGEAILKNYSLIKVNNISNDAKEIYLKAIR